MSVIEAKSPANKGINSKNTQQTAIVTTSKRNTTGTYKPAYADALPRLEINAVEKGVSAYVDILSFKVLPIEK